MKTQCCYLPKVLRSTLVLASLLSGGVAFAQENAAAKSPPRQTTVTIARDEFHLNGQPTYAGRFWRGHKIQGLLLNSRMVQGIFDDRNPDTVQRWAYPDTGRWDAERNTREFLAAMPEWRRHGLLAFTINVQGGSPEGYSKDQPWHNSGLEAEGSLRADYFTRLERILDRADALGLVVILGYFYFGQDQRLRDEAAVHRATDNITQWLFDRNYRHVLVEINNECNVRYDHPILQPKRVHELIERVKHTTRDGRRLLVGTSYGGGTIPLENVVRASDFLLIHGNGVSDPNRLADLVRKTRAVPGYRPMPIVFNEDDHFDFDQPWNNFIAALSEYASWGYFDPGKNNYRDGYQSPPVNWGLNTERKRAFFRLVSEITGTGPDAAAGPSTAASGKVTVQKTAYHGWADSWVLRNGSAEVAVVPAVGRVMQFRFAGQADGPFWENRLLDGQAPDPTTKEWINFGGDKTWPAPQADWPKVTPRDWPPPVAFDAMPVRAGTAEQPPTIVRPGQLWLQSPVDPHYGIRTVRWIDLHPTEPLLHITTVYEKVQGDPVKVSIWVVTQLAEPVGVYVPVPPDSPYPQGYNLQTAEPPPSLKVERGLISLVRNPKTGHKIGNDAGSLLWVGDKVMVRVDSPRVPGAEYPDQGSSAEVWTNPDPLPYIELETLGPLHPMKVGDTIERKNTYRLLRRTHANPETDARRALGLTPSP